MTARRTASVAAIAAVLLTVPAPATAQPLPWHAALAGQATTRGEVITDKADQEAKELPRPVATKDGRPPGVHVRNLDTGGN